MFFRICSSMPNITKSKNSFCIQIFLDIIISTCKILNSYLQPQHVMVAGTTGVSSP